MSVYIEIRDTDNSIVGQLDVGNSDDAPLSLTRKLSDFRELNKRSGVFSTDFEIPLTDANSTLLPNISDANLKNTKEFFKRKDAIVFSSDVLVTRGKLQLLDIVTRNGVKYLNFTFFGDNLEWATELAELSLSEINFSDSSFSFDSTSVKDSWTNTADDSDFVFAAIHRGQLLSQQNTWITRDFRPDLFVKRILSTSFNQIGFNLESTFFDTSGFESLILPYFGGNSDDWKHTATTVNNNKIIVGNTSAVGTGQVQGYEVREYSTGQFTCNTGTTANIPIAIDSGGAFTDPNNIYNTSTYVFENFDFFGEWIFDYKLDIDSLSIPFSYSDSDVTEIYFEYQNPNSGLLDRQLVHRFSGKNSPALIQGSLSTYVDSVAGGVARFFIKYLPVPVGDVYTLNDCSTDRKSAEYTFGTGTTITATPKQIISYGIDITLKSVLSSDFFVLTLINDLTKMFNLYWRTDSKTNTVYVEPRDDFYTAISTATDYTDKIDLSNEYKLTDFSSVYKRYLDFEYATDSNDKYLEERNRLAKGRGGADASAVDDLDLGANYEDGQVVMKHDAIAATYRYDSGSFTPWFARMWQEWSIDAPAYSTDFAPRILSYNYNTQTQSATNTSRLFRYYNESIATVEETTLIPYALDFSLIKNGIMEAEVKQVLTYNSMPKTLATRKSLVEDYYSGTVQFLKDGKNLMINMILSLQEFRDIDFRTPIYFSAPEDIQGYWVFESMENVKVNDKLQSVKCSLNKIINYEPLSIGTVSQTDEDGAYDPRDEPPREVFTGSDLSGMTEISRDIGGGTSSGL